MVRGGVSLLGGVGLGGGVGSGVESSGTGLSWNRTSTRTQTGFRLKIKSFIWF